jgi:AcrR family transcriptional regulator
LSKILNERAGRTEAGRRRKAENRAKILAAAFTVFGDENGLHARIEDIADQAGVTRATFYNHFAGMIELREALTREVTHDFLTFVMATIATMSDPRDRSAVAIRYYLRRAKADPRWGWSMVNLSATGLIFGAETYNQAEQTVREGLDAGVFRILSVDLGRDILLGTSLAALGTILRKQTPPDYPEAVAGYILNALGVPHTDARRIAHQPLPSLASAEGN